MVVEQLHENSVVVNEGACAEWISEALNWHGVVVDADGSVDVELFSLDSFNVSGLFTKDSDSILIQNIITDDTGNNWELGLSQHS